MSLVILLPSFQKRILYRHFTTRNAQNITIFIIGKVCFAVKTILTFCSEFINYSNFTADERRLYLGPS